MGFTHLQPAEPTTVGYRLAVYAQDLLDRRRAAALRLRAADGEGHARRGRHRRPRTSVCCDGTARSADDREPTCSERSACEAREISTQTYPRKLDYLLLSALAGFGASLSKFAADVRILAVARLRRDRSNRSAQSKSAVRRCRSSATRSCASGSIRWRACLPAYADVAWQNAATNLLERTLDDSANRRTILPEALLCADEILGARAHGSSKACASTNGAIAQNLRTYGPFAGTRSGA